MAVVSGRRHERSQQRLCGAVGWWVGGLVEGWRVGGLAGIMIHETDP